MKKKPGKYLKFYYKYIESREIPYRQTEYTAGGLCSVFGSMAIDVFRPTSENCDEYRVEKEGYFLADFAWDADADTYFGPTRQNVVLFLAAMKGEL